MALVGNTHLIKGGAAALPTLIAFLKKEGIKTEANPDLYTRTYGHFGIEEARDINARAAMRALGEQRIFVIVAPDMNREAQNALLKTLEEPSANAMFFFIVPSPETLLPTLRSRAQMLALSNLKESTTPVVDAAVFLKASPQKRLDLLKPLLEKGDDDRRNLGAILDFLFALERSLGKERKAASLHAVYRARKYIADKGALVKPLLEQVALLV